MRAEHVEKPLWRRHLGIARNCLTMAREEAIYAPLDPRTEDSQQAVHMDLSIAWLPGHLQWNSGPESKFR
jgi:hypothetical protein